MKKKVEQKKLPKRFKTKWIKALRSGEYEQAESELYAGGNSYCCIGVAGRVCGIPEEKMIGVGLFYEDSPIYDIAVQHKVPSMLLGGEGFKNSTLMADKLSQWNDGGKSFKWIASYIERYL